jgi:hypothetical protein
MRNIRDGIKQSAIGIINENKLKVVFWHWMYIPQTLSYSYHETRVRIRRSFNTSNTAGVPCKKRSKISIGLTSSPAASIFNFCHRCGSGVNGAKPSNMAMISNVVNGILSNHFIL